MGESWLEYGNPGVMQTRSCEALVAQPASFVLLTPHPCHPRAAAMELLCHISLEFCRIACGYERPIS